MKKLLVTLLVLLGLQTQAQINYCDSIEISIVNSNSTSIELETNASNFNWSNNPYTIKYDWTLNNFSMNWNWVGWDSLPNPYFPVTPNTPYYNDTLLVCLTVMIYDSVNWNSLTFNCFNNCEDTLVWNGESWGWPRRGTAVTSVQELEIKTISDNKIYDLLGRELLHTPTGTMYIQNKQKYIKLN